MSVERRRVCWKTNVLLLSFNLVRKLVSTTQLNLIQLQLKLSLKGNSNSKCVIQIVNAEIVHNMQFLALFFSSASQQPKIFPEKQEKQSKNLQQPMKITQDKIFELQAPNIYTR